MKWPILRTIINKFVITDLKDHNYKMQWEIPYLHLVTEM